MEKKNNKFQIVCAFVIVILAFYFVYYHGNINIADFETLVIEENNYCKNKGFVEGDSKGYIDNGNWVSKFMGIGIHHNLNRDGEFWCLDYTTCGDLRDKLGQCYDVIKIDKGDFT